MIVTRSDNAIRCQRPSRNAARAAATARSTSAAVPSGTRPTSSRVAGLRTSSHAPLDEGTDSAIDEHREIGGDLDGHDRSLLRATNSSGRV